MENANIMWYEDDELAIGFNSMPHVCVRYITPSMTETEAKSIKKYPFICKTELKETALDYLEGHKDELLDKCKEVIKQAIKDFVASKINH